MAELERKLLARLSAPDEVTRVWDAGVRAEVFLEPLYQAVFNFTVDYWLKAQMKQVPTPWVLAQEFPGYAVTDDAEEATDYLAELLCRRYVSTKLQKMLTEAASTSVRDPVGTLKTLHAAAYAASEIVTPRALRLNMADTIAARRERYGQRSQYPQGLGVPLGIDLLDMHTGGILPGELAVVGAYSKVGKTMFALHAAAQAVRKGYHPLVFTLEMSLHECEDRLDAMFSGKSYNDLSRGQLGIDELLELQAAQDELAALGGLAIERPEEGDRTVVNLCSRTRQLGCDYLIIDQLSFMEPGVKVTSLKEHHAVIMKGLKNEISRARAEIPCLLAVQSKRESEEMSLSSFSNATEIEQTVDLALGLSRNQDMRNNHCMKVEILGSRRCDTGAWLLEWELIEATRIRALERITQ